MDQRAHAGNKQQPDGRQRIEQETGIGVERGRSAVPLDVVHVAGIGTEPGVDNLLERLARVVMRVSGVLPDRKAGKDKRQRHRAHTDRAHRRFCSLRPKKNMMAAPKAGSSGIEPDVVEKEHF